MKNVMCNACSKQFFFQQEKNVDVRGLPIASVLSSDSLKKNFLLTSCTNEFSDPDVYQSLPLQCKYSWSLAWKFLLLKGNLNKSDLSRSTQNHSSSQTTDRRRYCSNTLHMLRQVLRNFQLRLQECLNCNGRYLED